MARYFRHASRLLGWLVSRPTAVLKAAKSLPDYLDSRDFCSAFPAFEAAEGPEVSNPLLDYFDSNLEGRGIWKWRHYFDIYHRHLQKFRNRQVAVAEIGIFSGGSLGMWRDYFGDAATIHGIDLDESTKAYASDHVSIHIGDQENRSFWRTFRRDVPQLDVCIDDGGHSPQQQRVTLEEVLPHLRPGGVYICEDITGHSNDFSSYIGGLIASLNDGVAGNESRATPFQQAIYAVHC